MEMLQWQLNYLWPFKILVIAYYMVWSMVAFFGQMCLYSVNKLNHWPVLVSRITPQSLSFASVSRLQSEHHPLPDLSLSFSLWTDHRHTFHHTHHPLSTHLPPQHFRKRVLSMDRRRKKKRKKKKTSMPPSDVTPTIHEVDEEEAESEMEGQCQAATPTEPSEELPQVTSTHSTIIFVDWSM